MTRRANTAAYNTWYDSTYDTILTMADWSRLDVDVPNKLICIYGWMPQTIMGIRHTGGQPKWATFSLTDVQTALGRATRHFRNFHRLDLRVTKLDKLEQTLNLVFSILFPPLGSVVASKYLHFSAPKFIPMWDRAIRLSRGYTDSPQGFFAYIREFKAELANSKNLNAAHKAYPANPIRGWDIVNMKARSVSTEAAK